MSNNAGAFSGGAGVVDDILGQAYLIVKHVYDNLTVLAAVAARTDALDAIKANIDLAETSILAQNMAIVLAGVTNFRATYAEALADFDVGLYFTSKESGELRLYKRIADAPGYEDMGDVVAPVSRTLLAASTGAALIGTSEEGIDVQEALTARVKATVLAGTGGAAMVGTSEEGINVQEALDSRPTTESLTGATAGAGIGVDSLAGETVTGAINNLIVSDETTANLNSIISTVNTENKFKGKMVWNTTALKLCIALGPEVDDGWITSDGETIYAPA